MGIIFFFLGCSFPKARLCSGCTPRCIQIKVHCSNLPKN
uniref:Uncharacterized protein n=1 Tax=Anguilla anguilla TaxID=7936 RepID=A0A0E9XBH9_ANGAN